MLMQNIIRRTLATAKPKISEVFIRSDVQQLLKDVTRFEEAKIFANTPVPNLNSPKMMFMSDEQLVEARRFAYETAKARTQMPPVLEANTSDPKVLARDEEVVGYSQFKIMFVDISPGSNDNDRLMSVRETDGTLRYPTHEERSRLNHMFYPGDYRSLTTPKLFEKTNMDRLLRDKKYIYILDRACSEFEPDDPRYVTAAETVYDHVDRMRDYDELRSTRFFGPMTLYLFYNQRIEGLVSNTRAKGYKEDLDKLVELYKICNNTSDVPEGLKEEDDQKDDKEH